MEKHIGTVITYLQLAHPAFQQAMDAICNCPGLDTRTSYSAYRLRMAIDKATKECGRMQKEIAHKYCKKDEKGEPIFEDGVLQFEADDQIKGYEKDFQENFAAKVLELKVAKLNFEALTPVRGITPKMWPHIECVMVNLPIDPSEEEANLPNEAEPVREPLKLA